MDDNREGIKEEIKEYGNKSYGKTRKNGSRTLNIMNNNVVK